MRKHLTSLSLFTVLCGVAGAQAVKVDRQHGSPDLWGRYYNSGKMLTFSGRVTGIEIVKPTTGLDGEVTLLVRNQDGGGTSVVDVGPAWYVNHQTAKIRVKDVVQVTGSKVIIDGHGLVLAKMIRINGQGGLVASLRRQSGRAYWVGTEVAQNVTVPTGPNVRTGRISNFSTYNVGNVPYGTAVLQTDNGLVNVDLGPQWYYNEQNVAYQIGEDVSVVVGPNPITVGPNVSFYPSYSIYRGNNVYTIRNDNGSPVYLWGGN